MRGYHCRGLALPVALLLLFILTLLLVESIGTAAGETTLAANQQFFQRAFEAAEGGLAAGMFRLARATGTSTTQRFALAREGSATDRSDTELVQTGLDALPPGFSAGRFIARHYEIRSTGHSERAARVELVQGAVRIEGATP